MPTQLKNNVWVWLPSKSTAYILQIQANRFLLKKVPTLTILCVKLFTTMTTVNKRHDDNDDNVKKKWQRKSQHILFRQNITVSSIASLPARCNNATII